MVYVTNPFKWKNESFTFTFEFGLGQIYLSFLCLKQGNLRKLIKTSCKQFLIHRLIFSTGWHRLENYDTRTINRAISQLTSSMEGKMLLGPTLDVSFDEKVFLLIVTCNLSHKAAFMNFMFPKHCPINLLGLKFKMSLVITLDIHFLWKAFLLITRYDLSCKHGIMSFNVPTNLFWNFAQICAWNLNRAIRTLKVPFSTINKDLRWSLCISFTKLM